MLSADRQFPKKGQGRHYSRGVDGGSEIFYGALVGINAAGYLVPAADTAGITVVGVAEKHVDNTDGDDGDVECPYVTGVDVEFDNTGGNIGAGDHLAFAETDEAVNDYGGSTNKNYVGPVVKRTAAKAWVHVDESHIAAYYAAIQYSDANDST